MQEKRFEHAIDLRDIFLDRYPFVNWTTIVDN